MEKAPFQVGSVNPEKGFVHVLDDLALDTLMRELDTVYDFTSYLSDKEALVSSGRLGISAGEEDLLGFIYRNRTRVVTQASMLKTRTSLSLMRASMTK